MASSTKASSFIDSSLLHNQSEVPSNFIWPEGEIVPASEEAGEPLIDLGGFFKGDEVETKKSAELIHKACIKHGFFQVVNHGVDSDLINATHHYLDCLFKLPLDLKSKNLKTLESLWGFSIAHSDRFSSKLPWKETFSFGFHEDDSRNPSGVVVDFFTSTLGKDFEEVGIVFQKYCQEMSRLSLALTELLAISLGINQMHYRNFFEDSRSIMRFSYYPSCKEPSLVMGTGPHCDPASLTLLHQDNVGGLEIFVDNKWKTVKPCDGAFVINIGETFTALTNGKYKSCLHRAVVNGNRDRKSMAFFLCPKEDKVVKPPELLVCSEGTRKYPDFIWSELLEFTQKHYRPNEETLQNFTEWLGSFKRSNISSN